MRRLRLRGRAGESVTQDYQSKLLQKHEAIFGSAESRSRAETHIPDEYPTTQITGKPVPVLPLYTDEDFRREDSVTIQRIANFLETVQKKRQNSP